MEKQKRIRDYGITIGRMKPGAGNRITDVAGVTVGHVTINNELAKTGVTAVIPHPGSLFQEKVMAASHVINGFGKTAGTIQIEELGTIETPIILTNTLSVGVATDALIHYMLQHNEDIGCTTGTVNPVVCECNDGYLNDIRGGHVMREHVLTAIHNAEENFAEGSVGAGTGMSCYGLKGGIGSASRVMDIDDSSYTVGVLVLANFGTIEDLTIDGYKAGRIISEIEKQKTIQKEMGSIIVIIATDLPTTERQLKRMAKRAAVGIGRTGSFIANGSGEIVIAFSTANKVKHYETQGIIDMKAMHDNVVNDAFRAVVEATEEAILNVLICADTTQGRDGHHRDSLREYLGSLDLKPSNK